MNIDEAKVILKAVVPYNFNIKTYEIAVQTFVNQIELQLKQKKK